MLSRALRNFVLRQVAAVCRQVVLRGRDSAKLYSCEDHEVDAAEPESKIAARRAGRYGFVSECPPGALVAVLKVGKGNYVGVAETVPGEPEIEEGEVLLWTKFGQRLKFTKDGDVVVLAKEGRGILLGSDDPSEVEPVITFTDIQNKLNALATHTHSGVTTGMGTSGTSPALTGLAVTGSPVVRAKKP